MTGVGLVMRCHGSSLAGPTADDLTLLWGDLGDSTTAQLTTTSVGQVIPLRSIMKRIVVALAIVASGLIVAAGPAQAAIREIGRAHV